MASSKHGDSNCQKKQKIEIIAHNPGDATIETQEVFDFCDDKVGGLVCCRLTQIIYLTPFTSFLSRVVWQAVSMETQTARKSKKWRSSLTIQEMEPLKHKKSFTSATAK